MNTRNTCRLFLILIPLFVVTACEQQTASNLPASSRITFAANEHDKQIGEYVIHVNALTNSQLPAVVARGYNISRSQSRAMMNVAVRRKMPEGELPITASVKVIAKNLSNQLKDVDLREIKEDEPLAIYYIGVLPVSHEETIVFDLDVIPEGESEPVLLSYRQQFFTE